MAESKLAIDLSKFEGAVEADAKDALAWLTKEGIKIATSGPKAIAALGVLLGAVEQFLTDADTAQLTAALAQIKPVWNDLKSFAATLGIKL